MVGVGGGVERGCGFFKLEKRETVTVGESITSLLSHKRGEGIAATGTSQKKNS